MHCDPISVWIPLPVVAKQRARMTKKRRGRRQFAYTPEATRNFETGVAELFTTETGGITFGNQPVCVEIDIHREGFVVSITPAECSVRPVGIRGDIDNYVKSIFDGLNGVAWDDDRQVELVTVGFVGEPRKKR